MVYAPIIIPTLNRSKHFVRCIESLKQNTYAKYTDVYIVLDYPLNDNHYDGYKKICKYLETSNFDIFKSFTVIRREKNYGAFQNMISALDDVIIPNYDVWCRADDDIEFSKNFLEYIDKCLDKYKDDPSVIGVTGYSYPCNYHTSKNNNVIKENFYCSMWGTAFYKNKYLMLRSNISDNYYLHFSFEKNIRNKSYKNLLNSRFIDFVDAGLSWQKNKLAYDVCDVAISMFIALENYYIIYPTLSKTRNLGFDGSGNTCQNLEKDFFTEQAIDTSDIFDIKEDSCNDLKKIKESINQFDYRNIFQISKAYIKIIIYKIIGIKMYKKAWMILKGRKYKSFFDK